MKNLFLKVWCVILSLFIILHSTITIAYNFPNTPLKEKFEPAINSYIEPLFTQTWTLFAPTPVNTNTLVEVKFTDSNNKESEWISFSDLIHDKSQSNFLSNYQFYSSILVQMEGEASKVSQELINFAQETKNDFTQELYSEDFVNRQSDYIDEIYDIKKIDSFFYENPKVHSLYGFTHNFFEEAYFEKITSMQIRLSAEFFPEYGQEGNSEFMLLYLPKVNTDDL